MKFKLYENMDFKSFVQMEKQCNRELNEASLSRLHMYMDNYDTAFITAFRYSNSKKTNLDNNHELKMRLSAMGYNMFRVKGNYHNQETGVIDKKESYAVINSAKLPFDRFVDDMKYLGGLYNQESVLIFPKGESGSFYYGNGKIVPAGSKHFGNDSDYKSLVNGRSFVVEELELCDNCIKTQAQYEKYKRG